jgi:uncharacterized protein (DUF362 family)
VYEDLPQTQMSRVALTRCQAYQPREVRDAVRRQFELLGLAGSIRRADLVLVKPNMIAPRPPGSAVQTHPLVVTEVAKCLLDLGARPMVGDSPAWGTLGRCAAASGLDLMLRSIGVPLVRLNRPTRQLLSDGRTWVPISSIVKEVDHVINLPQLKAPQQLSSPIAVKNMFGCVPGKTKPFWHMAKGRSVEEFSQFLVRLCQVIDPTATIIDAVVGMEGPGPINGRPREIGYLVGSRDPIAAERICSQMVGVDPSSVPIIAAARALGMAVNAPLDLVGDLPLMVCQGFKIPTLVPVWFSPGRVAKSIMKGLVAVLRGVIKRRGQ